MLGVENEGDVHHPALQFARCLLVQQRQEVATDALFVGVEGDAYPVVAEFVPVEENAREGGQQPIRHFMLVLEAIFRLQIAEHGAAGAQHIHGMGVGGNALEHLQQGGRQGAQAAQGPLVILELLLVRQLALEQQVGDLFELGAVGQLWMS